MGRANTSYVNDECFSRVAIGDYTRLFYTATVKPDLARFGSQKLVADMATPCLS